MALMNFYTLDASFDEDKYWNYGCNCMIHGDRPLSDMGTGPGVDRLDKKCREYKLCQQCARAQHGEMCIGEFIAYRRPRTKVLVVDGVEETHKVCRDTPNTCERALCECDLQFAKDHAKMSVCLGRKHSGRAGLKLELPNGLIIRPFKFYLGQIYRYFRKTEIIF